jgi:hypothetical protein
MENKGVMVPLLLAIGAAVFYLAALTSRERALIGDYEIGCRSPSPATGGRGSTA